MISQGAAVGDDEDVDDNDEDGSEEEMEKEEEKDGGGEAGAGVEVEGGRRDMKVCQDHFDADDALVSVLLIFNLCSALPGY